MSLVFYNYNLVDKSSTVITATAESAYFPASNLKDPRRSKVFRNEASSAQVVFDFITTETVDSICLVPHIKNGWGFTSVTVQANATNTWGSPAFTTTINTEIDQEHEIAFKEFASQAYRFWRLTFNGTTFTEVGKVFIGSKLDFGRGPDLNWSMVENDMSVIQENKYGQAFIDEYGKRKLINVTYNYMDKNEVDNLFKVIDYNSITRPLFARFTCEDILNNINRFSGYFYLAQNPEIVNPSYALYNASITLKGAM